MLLHGSNPNITEICLTKRQKLNVSKRHTWFSTLKFWKVFVKMTHLAFNHENVWLMCRSDTLHRRVRWNEAHSFWNIFPACVGHLNKQNDAMTSHRKVQVTLFECLCETNLKIHESTAASIRPYKDQNKQNDLFLYPASKFNSRHWQQTQIFRFWYFGMTYGVACWNDTRSLLSIFSAYVGAWNTTRTVWLVIWKLQVGANDGNSTRLVNKHLKIHNDTAASIRFRVIKREQTFMNLCLYSSTTSIDRKTRYSSSDFYVQIWGSFKK